MTTLTSIYDIMKSQLRYQGDRHSGRIGVEIETETLKAYDYPRLNYWNLDRDNSLRDFGVEYILKSPMDLVELERALSEFDSCNKKYKFKDSSISTSVHIHLNFLNETFLTLANFFTTYAILENLFIRYSGPDRLSNLFCLPICDAEGVATSIRQMLMAINKKSWKNISNHPDRVKYGAINTAPLTRIGTIEVRSFRGETDTQIIKTWARILIKLVDWCRQDITPVDIINKYGNNPNKFLSDIFGEDWKVLACKDYLQLMEQNVKYAVSFAECSRNWKEFGIIKVKPVYREQIKPILDDYSMSVFNVPFDLLDFYGRNLIVEMYHRNNPTTKVVTQTEDV